MSEIEVIHNEAESRFEATVEGRLSVLDYRRRGDALVFTHTGVPSELRGRGIAAALTKFALDHARDAGLTVVPQCSYVATYIERHPEYEHLS